MFCMIAALGVSCKACTSCISCNSCKSCRVIKPCISCKTCKSCKPCISCKSCRAIKSCISCKPCKTCMVAERRRAVGAAVNAFLFQPSLALRARLRCPVFAARVAARLQKADCCPCYASAASSAVRASASQSRKRGRSKPIGYVSLSRVRERWHGAKRHDGEGCLPRVRGHEQRPRPVDETGSCEWLRKRGAASGRNSRAGAGAAVQICKRTACATPIWVTATRSSALVFASAHQSAPQKSAKRKRWWHRTRERTVTERATDKSSKLTSLLRQRPLCS